MKNYDELVKDLREQQQQEQHQTAGSAYSLGVVWHLWAKFAPLWNPTSESSRENVREFWSGVADWAGKLAIAASICEKKGVDDENR